MLSFVEHEQSFITSGPDLSLCCPREETINPLSAHRTHREDSDLNVNAQGGWGTSQLCRKNNIRGLNIENRCLHPPKQFYVGNFNH